MVRRDLGEVLLRSPLTLLKLRVEGSKNRQGTDITAEAVSAEWLVLENVPQQRVGKARVAFYSVHQEQVAMGR